MNSTPPSAATTDQKTILVVDNVPTMLRLVEGFLRDDYSILTVLSAEHALQVLARQKVDLIITDIRMPLGMHGLEFAAAVRNDPETCEIPILFCTAVADKDTLLTARRIGNMRAAIAQEAQSGCNRLVSTGWVYSISAGHIANRIVEVSPRTRCTSAWRRSCMELGSSPS